MTAPADRLPQIQQRLTHAAQWHKSIRNPQENITTGAQQDSQ